MVVLYQHNAPLEAMLRNFEHIDRHGIKDANAKRHNKETGVGVGDL